MMNCPHCNTHIDEHPANACLNRRVDACVMGWHKIEGAEIYLADDGYWHTKDGDFRLRTIAEGATPDYSGSISAAKEASDKAGSTVIFAPHSSVRDGCYANRKKEWLVEIIPHGGTTQNAFWAYGETEELARCRAAIKISK